jgi:hypothetical protein
MKIYVPWSEEQVAALNAAQAAGRHTPVLCAVDHFGPAPKLVAYWNGWRCWVPDCGYSQTWAYEWMADPEIQAPPKETMRERIMREMPESIRLALVASLDEPSPPGPSGNAEDCHICCVKNLPYPFICECPVQPLRPRYALHAGTVRSENDGQFHQIGVTRLAALYRLGPQEWVAWNNNADHLRIGQDYIHLFPRHDGDYRVPGRDF